MPQSPAPAFVRINSHSIYGPHTAEIPTLAWAGGQFSTWASGLIDDDVMIGALVDMMAPFYPTTYTFDNWLAFSQPTPDDDPLPVNSGTFTSKVGTAATPGWTKAVQLTMTVRSTLFGIAKYVFLDAASGDNFNPIRTPDSSMTDMLTVLNDVTNGWAARDNGRPENFLGLTKTLNEKLRKAYRMT